MKQQSVLLIGLFFLFFQTAFSQGSGREEHLTIDGEIVTAIITETDTIILANLDVISFSSPRKFKDRDERRRFYKYRRYANLVYPYAKQAIRIFRETEYVTQTMSKKKRKKHIKRLQKELKDEFRDPLKDLTKTQGKILVKMIEKELDTPFYDLLKGLRGGFTASYWHQFSKFYGYDLKEGYIPGDDKILDAVLNDFNISYTVKN